MSVLSRYYELLTFVTIANGEVKEIDPDKPYTVVYYQDSRMLAQSTGLIRGVIGEPDVIVTIPLDAEDVNYATIISTRTIVSIDPYSFDAHFDNFNNWIGVEVAEHNCIQMRVKFVNAESIVMVEEGKTYEVGFIYKGNGGSNYITATGKVKSILRNTTKEAMPSHSNHFTNDIDYIVVFDFGEQLNSSIVSVNVIDIRVIKPYINPIRYDVGLLNELYTEVEAHKGYSIDRREYTHRSYTRYKEAYLKALEVITTNEANLTNAVLQSVLEDLKSAFGGLQDIDDEYDIVQYDKESHTLSCNESIYPVLLMGIGEDCIEVVSYTNFGSKRIKHINNTNELYVQWSGFEPITDRPKPDEDMVEQIRKEFFEVRPTLNHAMGSGQLFIMNCNMADLDLGIRVEVVESMGEEALISKLPSRMPLSSPATYIEGCNISNVYVSGYGVDTVSRYGNIVIRNSKFGDIIIGGCNSSLYDYEEGIGVEDMAIPTYHCDYLDMQMYSSDCDNLWCGGIGTKTSNVYLHIRGLCNIGTLYASGLNESLIHDVDIRIVTDTDEGLYLGIPEIEDFIGCDYNAAVSKLRVYNEGHIKHFSPAAFEIHTDSEIITSEETPLPAIVVEFAKTAVIDEFYKAYSKGELLPDKELKICCPKILMNEYDRPTTEETPDSEDTGDILVDGTEESLD